MAENYNEIIVALLERISVLERELAETRKLPEEKDVKPERICLTRFRVVAQESDWKEERMSV